MAKRVMNSAAASDTIGASNSERSAFRARFPVGYIFSYAIDTVFLGLFAAAGFGWLLARRILIPPKRLHESVTRLASGDLGHRVAVSAAGEFGALAENFNRMAEALQRHRVELRE